MPGLAWVLFLFPASFISTGGFSHLEGSVCPCLVVASPVYSTYTATHHRCTLPAWPYITAGYDFFMHTFFPC